MPTEIGGCSTRPTSSAGTAVWVPNAAHEALRDLVRARESAKKDQLRARQRLGKFLLRHGHHRPPGMNAWTQQHLAWVKTVHVSQAAQEATLVDYLHEVEHMAGRVMRLETAIDQAVEQVPTPMRAVIGGLQALRGDRADLRGHHRRRTGQAVPLSHGSRAHGLQRGGAA